MKKTKKTYSHTSYQCVFACIGSYMTTVEMQTITPNTNVVSFLTAYMQFNNADISANFTRAMFHSGRDLNMMQYI